MKEEYKNPVPKGDHLSGEIEITRQIALFENEYLRIFNDRVIFPSGKEGTYFRLETPTNLGVGVLPVTEQGALLLIKTYRHAARGWGYEMPKGGVGQGEDAEQAARRELMEETGYAADRLVYLGEYYESPAIYSSKMKFYLGLDCHRVEDIRCEDTEAISAVEQVEAGDFLKKSGELDFCDAITELAYYKYLAYKEGEYEL